MVIVLPQTALIKVARIGIKDVPVHIYGPKKYLLFGKREILHTLYLPGQAHCSDVRIDFGNSVIVPGAKINVVMFDHHTYYGVIPHDETAPNVWECHVDHYKSRD